MSKFVKISKHQRRLEALKFALKYPDLLKKSIKDSISFLYANGKFKRDSLKKISPDIILNGNKEMQLYNCSTREGNTTYQELLLIASLIAQSRPTNLLEIGTFDGNTTLQMALNAPPNACVHTLDLDDTKSALPMWDEDVKYVTDQEKKSRKYLASSIKDKIVQHIGDSSIYDFSKFTQKGKIDFCFIDGGHSYECVKRDTEKTLAILSERGIIVWHDFNPNCPGVFQFLIEQAKTLPLVHIEGTSLVIQGLNEASTY